MTGRRRPKSVRRARALAIAREERLYSKEPHSFVFTRPGVGKFVKQLSLDMRHIFEPNTATRLKVHRGNVLKDFVAVAGPLNVSHLLYLTHPHSDKRNEKRQRQLAKKVSKQLGSTNDQRGEPGADLDLNVTRSTEHSGGGVYLHLIRVPHGPSLTFSVVEYSLQRDVLTLIRRIFNSHQYNTPPLLAMTGFGSRNPNAPPPKQPQPPPPHLRLVVDMFQNMLPSLNVQKLKLSTVHRVLLISREVDLSTAADSSDPEDVIYIRHYHIRTENRTVSRALRRLGVGGVKLKKRKLAGASRIDSGLPMDPSIGPGGFGKSSNVPNLSKYTCIEDFITKSGMLSDSGLSDALSDMEEVELPGTASLPSGSISGSLECPGKSKKRKFVPSHGLRHLGTAKTATVRLTEIGPRLTLRLIKVEEGLNTGSVLYHRWQSRSLVQATDQAERLRQREALRAKRRAQHETRRAANQAAREAHRAACIEGMRRAGQLPPKQQSDQSESSDDQPADFENATPAKSTTKLSDGTLGPKRPKLEKMKHKKSVTVGRRPNPTKNKKVKFSLKRAPDR